MTGNPHVLRAFRIGREVHDVDLRLAPRPGGGGGTLSGVVNGAHVTAEAARVGASEVTVLWAGRRTTAVVARRGETIIVSFGGRSFELVPAPPGAGAGHGAGGAAPVGDPFATSPMTGLLVKVHAAPGDAVARGAPLFAVEAMKMEYVVSADRDVVVEEVRHVAGARVDVGDVVVTFREDPAPAPAPDAGGAGT